MEEASNKRRSFLLRRIDHSSEFGGVIGAICLLAVTFIIVMEVVLRYVFNSPASWVGEIIILLSMGIGFMGLAFALKGENHISITFLVDFLSPKNKLRMKVFTNIISAGYCGILVYKGTIMAHFSYILEDVTSGVLAVPLWIPGALIPLAGLLMVLQFINILVDDVRALKKL